MKRNFFNKQEITAFEPEAKIGLISTLNRDNFPHITLITSIQAKDQSRLIWGEFISGLSKKQVISNRNTGFLILTMDKLMWRGKAIWSHKKNNGPDYELLNNKPMFRYNSYFGIHTVHYMDLIETTGCESLPLTKIIISTLITWLGKLFIKSRSLSPALKPWAYSMINKFSSMKFLSYVDSEGFPSIIPLFQCQASDNNRLVFSSLAYKKEILSIPKGSQIAIFALTVQMESVLVRGIFSGINSFAGIPLGYIDINWVYNSMPPKHGQIFPLEPVKPVTSFNFC